MSVFPERSLSVEPDVLAPDGSEVRLLVAAAGGSMAHFLLHPGQVSRAVRHRTVAEVWFVTAGEGRIWRSSTDGEEVAEEVTALRAGVSIAIPQGTAFQFRADSAVPLEIVDTTMPPWPGDDEVEFVDGAWEPQL